MKFFRKDRVDKSPQTEQRSLTLQDIELANMLGIEIEGISSNKMKEATFFACIRILQDSVSKLPLKLYRDLVSGREKATDHYLYSKLRLRPNKLMSASDFWKTVEFQRSYYGHSVVVIESLPNGKVNALHPLDMSRVKIWVDDKAIIGKETDIWYIYNDDKSGLKFRSDEVLHFIGTTRDGLQGMAVKDYLGSTIENMQYSTNHVNNSFKSGLSVGGILQYTGDLSQDSINRMRTKFEEMATGMKNVNRILPVPVGFEFNTIRSTMADQQFLEINQLTIRQICSAFGIKPHQINDLSGAKFNNVQQMNDEFYRDTLQSILTSYEQELTYKLLTEKEIKNGMFFEFNVDAILRSSLKDRYDAYSVGIDKGFLKPNEAREKENLPPVDGGDQLIVNGTYQPLDQVGMAYRDPSENSLDANEGGENDDENEQ